MSAGPKQLNRGPVFPVSSHGALNLAGTPQEMRIRYADGTVVTLKGRTLQKWVTEQHYMIEKTFRDAQESISDTIKSAAINDVLSKHTRTDA